MAFWMGLKRLCVLLTDIVPSLWEKCVTKILPLLACLDFRLSFGCWAGCVCFLRSRTSLPREANAKGTALWEPSSGVLCLGMPPLSLSLPTHTYLAGEIPRSRRWFTQGEAQPLHSGCADHCEFPKCGNLNCKISGSGGLRSRSPLFVMLKKMSSGSYF